MLATNTNIANKLINANKVHIRKTTIYLVRKNNYKNPSPLIKTLQKLQMQVLPFHDFIFSLKLASVSDSLNSSGNGP